MGDKRKSDETNFNLCRKEFVARVGEESLLKLTSGGLDDDDWAQVELEVEDENILEVVDTNFKNKGFGSRNYESDITCT